MSAISRAELEALITRTLSIFDTTLDGLGITIADVDATEYEPPTQRRAYARYGIHLTDGRYVEITKDTRAQTATRWEAAL